MAATVMLIECVGMIGVGKSTLARALNDVLVEQGLTVLAPAEATERCWRRSVAGKLAGRMVPAQWQHAVLRVGLFVVKAWSKLRFALEHPRLVWQVCAAQRRRTIPWWHRRLIVRLFFDAAGAYRLLRGGLAPGEVVIFEEGLIHRAINVYAWEPEQLPHDEVLAYFRRVPVCDVVVVVRAPYDVCVARANARGLPLRLRDKNEHVIAQFMQHSWRIIDTAAALLATTAHAVVDVDNGGTLERSVGALCDQWNAQQIVAKKHVDAGEHYLVVR